MPKNSTATQTLRLAQAALLSPPYATLSYLLPPGFSQSFWRPGLRLAVPLGRGLRAAVLLEIIEAEKPGYALKEIAWPLERAPLLSPSYLEYAGQFARRQALSAGRVLSNMLPAGLRDTGVTLRFFGANLPEDLKIAQIAALPAPARAELAALWENAQGKILRLKDSADEELYSLKAAPPWPVRPGAARQLALLEFLENRGLVTRRRITRELGENALPALKTLVQRGLIELTPETPPEIESEGDAAALLARCRGTLEAPPPFSLNAEQTAALEDFCSIIASGQAASRLLYGVTGSGKTAVYLELAARCLALGRSVLLMAPEVALALKLKRDAENRFPGLPIHLFHGYQPQATRENTFTRLARSAGPVLVIGTRSALFLQMPPLGAIILDEEHDSSFKQDERLNYQAKDLAWFLSVRDRALLLLGSATPDLKTFYAAEKGEIKMHRLAERAGGGSLPEVSLSLMPRGRSQSGILTPESSRALEGCLDGGGQAVILLNRRGYAPSMYCLDCGAVPRCPDCEISLTYHKSREKLICHYCGYSVHFPAPCPSCKSLHYLPMGEGTEKLEERLLSELRPGTRVLRLDRDSTSRPGSMEDILAAFGRGEAEVLVGTQMLSKGHHFPRVSLAVVADGDMGLNSLDYNAAERTFQLVVQASGRSGRGKAPGKVIIQTRDPSHYCWEYILRNDYEGFYRRELERRQKRRYPPFTRLALLRISYPLGWPHGGSFLARLADALQKAGKELGVTVLGPAPAPFPMRERRLRFQCLLKGQDWQNIRGVYNAAAALAPSGPELRLSLDIDPATTS